MPIVCAESKSQLTRMNVLKEKQEAIALVVNCFLQYLPMMKLKNYMHFLLFALKANLKISMATLKILQRNNKQ